MGLFDFLGSKGEKPQVVMPYYQEAFGKNVGQRGIQFLNDFYRQNPNGLNQNQNAALAAIQNTAAAGQGAGGAANTWLNNLLAGNGLNNQQTALASQLTQGQIANPAFAETQRIAMGGDVGNNPWLNRQFDQAAGRITDNFKNAVVPGMDTQFAQSGRLGSGAYAALRNNAEKQLGQTLSDTATSMYGNAYANDMAAKNAALTQLAGLGQQDVQNRLAGAGLYNAGTANATAGVSQGGNVQNLRYDDLNRLYGGATQQAQGFWNQMGQGANLMNSLQGGQAYGGSQGVDGKSQALQLGLSAASLWAMSDRRLKQNVERVGALPSGLPLYTYRYVWDPPEVWRVGVMAQEAAEIVPDAVAVGPAGYLMVDYARVR